jgi:hypothetical protein
MPKPFTFQWKTPVIDTQGVEKAFTELQAAHYREAMKEQDMEDPKFLKSIKKSYLRAMREHPTETMGATLAFGTFLLKIIETFAGAKSKNAYANVMNQRMYESRRDYKRRMKRGGF